MTLATLSAERMSSAHRPTPDGLFKVGAADLMKPGQFSLEDLILQCHPSTPPVRRPAWDSCFLISL